MIKVHLTIILSLISLFLFSQSKQAENYPISDCSGAVNIFKSGKYSLQFTGESGSVDELSNYPSLSDMNSKNVIWVSYIADNDGTLSFNANINQGDLQMIIFIEAKTNICSALSLGSAEIKRINKTQGLNTVGLDTNIANNALYPLDLTAGQKILIAFASVENSKAIITLDFTFKEKSGLLKIANNTKIYDSRTDEFSPFLSISIRDSKTNEPIIANITIEGSKEIAALYKGSDLYFNVLRASKVLVKCDAEGYFFVDQEVNLLAISNQEIVVKMNRLSTGSSIQIEEIEFKAGTSEFLPGSESRLNRLKDLLAINAEIYIEIQGHVFLKGENTFASQQMSEARAKRIMNYLIANGIQKDRMIAVGYGNTKPIFPDAKLDSEEQANRRVEIVIK
jgi:outer membrane protein OmpA-like peptidoglycan-associated protein